jgi:hypothetical protein
VQQARKGQAMILQNCIDGSMNREQDLDMHASRRFEEFARTMGITKKEALAQLIEEDLRFMDEGKGLQEAREATQEKTIAGCAHI